MQINKCRICDNTQLEEIGSLGNIAISDFTDKPKKGQKFPLTLVYCRKCTLVQLDTNTPRDLLYKDYWYESHINPVIVEDLKEIAKYSKGKETHIDIGANDGTLLRYSESKVKIGVEPAQNIECPRDAGIMFWSNGYWEDERIDVHKNTDLITAIACLYDLPDPNKFVKNVKDHLAKDGLFIAQFQPLEQMVELNDLGNICHEHLEYYSYKSLVYLFEKNGLEIFKVERNKMNGGSYRIFARHFKKGSIDFQEKEYSFEDLKAFFQRIEANKNQFLDFVSHHHAEIWGYGASTKANTIMQYYGYRPIAIVDINPDKIGKHPIGSGIIIRDTIPEGANICKYLWVFPYGFLDHFKEKEKDYKGKWVTTIPEFKII